MTSHGKAETAKLQQNLENQLDRLVQQLADLESCKYVFKVFDVFISFMIYFRSDIDNEEYEDIKQDTMDQLKELNDSLSKLVKGDISLVNAFGAMQLVG